MADGEPVATDSVAPSGEGASAVPTGKAAGEMVKFRVTFANVTHDIEFGWDRTLADLKAHLEETLGCAADSMKLMYKGMLAAPGKPALDSATLREKKVVEGCKVLCVGPTAAALAAREKTDKEAASGRIPLSASKVAGAGAGKAEKWAEQTEHKRVLDRGRPDDVMLAYRPGHDPLPQSISGLYLRGNNKIRIGFDAGTGNMILSTKDRTQRIPFRAIHSVRSQPIPNHEEYHILAGPTERSNMFIYWFPAQFINAFKTAIEYGVL